MYRVKQKDTSDCAVAALISIVKYYKGNINYEKLRNMMKCTKDGVSAYDLVKTANKIGFNAYGMKLNYDDLLNIKLPCIAHTIIKDSYMHYIVIEKVSNKVKVYDPYFGKRIYKKEDFLKIWTNVVIILEKNNIVKETVKNNLYKEILNEYKYKFILLSFISLILITLSIIGSFYLKILIENIDKSKLIFIIFSILFLTRYILEYITNKIIINIDMNIDKDLTLKTIKNILSLKEEYFINRQKGDVLSRINNIESIKTLLFKIPIQFFINLNIIIISVFILINLNKKLFFISIFIIFIYFFIYLAYFKKNKNYINILTEEKGYINGIINESIDGYKDIKVQGLLQSKLIEIACKYDNYLNISKKFNNLYNFESVLKNLYLLVSSNYILYTGVSVLSISNLILFYSILMMFIDSFKNIFDLEEEFTNGLVSINRLNEIYMEKNYGYYSNKVDNIDIEGLYFSYKNDDYIIKNLNLDINKGDRLLVKGNSGVGKSTLFALIQGEYTLDKGLIRLGNETINKWNKKGLERNITYGSINSKIFKGRVIDNIGTNKDRINSITKITNMNLDLEQYLEEDGSNISLGEKSKLILTRMLYKDSNVIILDELLNNIEQEEERNILLNLFKYYGNKIIMYTSHRNINESLFNKVLILKKGGEYEIN